MYGKMRIEINDVSGRSVMTDWEPYAISRDASREDHEWMMRKVASYHCKLRDMEVIHVQMRGKHVVTVRVREITSGPHKISP